MHRLSVSFAGDIPEGMLQPAHGGEGDDPFPGETAIPGGPDLFNLGWIAANQGAGALLNRAEHRQFFALERAFPDAVDSLVGDHLEENKRRLARVSNEMLD